MILATLVLALSIIISMSLAYILVNKDKVNNEELKDNLDSISSNATDMQIANAQEYYFFGKVIESNEKSIIVEPNENEDIRKSSDKVSIGLGENNDAIYVVGTNVKITYDGNIMESYPAQVIAKKIELVSVDKFNLVFTQKTDSEEKEVILTSGEVEGVNYNVYAYTGDIAINLNSDSSELLESSISLREALLQGKINMNEIIAKANKDLDSKIIKGDILKDGGTMIYKYENFTIIKYHTIDGKRDVYIGGKDMQISDLD